MDYPETRSRHGSDDTHLEAIRALGYSARDAAFLRLVVRAGGYFLRRHYLAYTGLGSGQAVVDFTRQLLHRRRATAEKGPRGRWVFRLAGAALADPTADDAPRVRRGRPPRSVRARLIALDLALAHPSVQWLASERERLAYVDGLGITRDWLPQQTYRDWRSGRSTTHYFVDRHLVGVTPVHGGRPTTVFAYLDEVGATVAAFRTYLRDYAQLLTALPCWRLMYVVEADHRAAPAGAVFARWQGADLRVRARHEPQLRVHLLEYCQLREAVEAERWEQLGQRELDRLHDLRALFSDGMADGVYVAWQQRGGAAVDQLCDGVPTGPGTEPTTGFETWRLPDTYGEIVRLRRSTSQPRDGGEPVAGVDALSPGDVALSVGDDDAEDQPHEGDPRRPLPEGRGGTRGCRDRSDPLARRIG